MSLQDTVHGYLREHGISGCTVLCGFSGGADSTSLLLALSGENVRPVAVHFQHGIRDGEADEDAEWCMRFCRERSIEMKLIYLDVPHNMLPGESTEEAARRLRLESWKRLSEGKLPVFLAHHADDVLEELFLRLARGSNASALVPMKPRRSLCGIDVCRPLLKTRRSEIEEWLKLNGVTDWRVDSTNLSCEYRRNAVRNELLPLFRNIFGNDAGLVRSLENIGHDADFLEKSALEMNPDSIDDWRMLHPAMLYRAVRLLLERRFAVPPAVTHNFMERLNHELLRYDGRAVFIPLNEDTMMCLDANGLDVLAGKILHKMEWNWRGCSRITALGWSFSLENGPGEGIEAFDPELLSDRIEIRTRRNGDRMVPFGAASPKKIQDLFTDAKVPRGMRENWPVLCSDGAVIWIPGVRRAQFAPISDDSGCIYIRAVRDSASE